MWDLQRHPAHCPCCVGGCAWLREGREILSSTIHHGCLRISSPLARVMISRSLVRDVSRVFSSRRSDDASRRAFQSRRDGRMHSGTECLVHVEMGRFSVTRLYFVIDVGSACLSSSTICLQAQNISHEVVEHGGFSLKFGILRWGAVCSALDIALAVMPGEFAMSSKRGAAASRERGEFFSTA